MAVSLAAWTILAFGLPLAICRPDSILLPRDGGLEEDRNASVPLPLEVTNVSSILTPENASPEYSYFERTYAKAGWFTSPPILNTHVEASLLPQLLSQRSRTHFPYSISVYVVPTPRPLVYFNIMWGVNSNSIGWRMSYEEDGTEFQRSLNNNINAGYQAYQVESYAYDNWGTIYYAAVFLDKKYWPSGTDWDITFGFPHDATYCCGPNSRWIQLSKLGYKPVSVSLTEDPATKRLYIADLWNTVNVGVWQGGTDKTAVELQQILGSLQNLSPVYLKGYRVTNRDGGHTILFSYLAKSMDALELTLTTDVSNTAFATLAKLLKKPPVAFTSYFFDGESDFQMPGYGGMYTALWEGVTTNY